MKIARIGTAYIVVIWILVVVLVGTVLLIGFQRNTADLRQLMMNEAGRLIEIVGVSARAGIHSLDEVESLSAERLFENARLIERMARTAVPPADTLTEIARRNNLHMIGILDASGKPLSRSVTEGEPPRSRAGRHIPEVERVLAGESEEEIIGFSEDRYYSGKPYGVVVARAGGGAVVVNTDSNEMLEFRKTVGLGTLLREIGSREGVSYIVLQDSLGIVAASTGVTEMTRIEDEPFLQRAEGGGWGVRTADYKDRPVIEVAHPLIVDDVNLGLLRIGLATEEVENIRRRSERHFIFLFITAMISGVFLFIFVILRQNYMILHSEHDRILGEVRRMEEDARRAERLASMGRLAGGVAHEIRNPLNAISIIAQRLKSEFTPTEERDEYVRYLSTIGSEISRISAIIEQFLKYARPPKLSFSDVTAGGLVSGVLTIIGEKARSENISLAVDVDDNLVCRCDLDQMKQALLNVLLNAIDASGSNGVISLSAHRNGAFAVFRVEDSGNGIPEDIAAKIFDPYFTTKEHGTGLGLSEVHRIISSHGGRIEVFNASSGGAVFEIYIPYSGAN